jgi:hypothetical protein
MSDGTTRVRVTLFDTPGTWKLICDESRCLHVLLTMCWIFFRVLKVMDAVSREHEIQGGSSCHTEHSKRYDDEL